MKSRPVTLMIEADSDAPISVLERKANWGFGGYVTLMEKRSGKETRYHTVEIVQIDANDNRRRGSKSMKKQPKRVKRKKTTKRRSKK